WMASIAFSPFEIKARKLLGDFAERASSRASLRLVNPSRLDELSPFGGRFDANAELNTGFPYTLAHASRIAELICGLANPPTPKKGLITDLDNTFWKGVVGDAGPDGVTWDLESHSYAHACYQGLLNSLADAGVFLAVASKNEPAVVAEALKRKDLVLDVSKLYP